jgi:hypothetical protein
MPGLISRSPDAAPMPLSTQSTRSPASLSSLAVSSHAHSSAVQAQPGPSASPEQTVSGWSSWYEALIEAGVPPQYAEEYEKLFKENDITLEQLPDITFESLQQLGKHIYTFFFLAFNFLLLCFTG